MLRKGLVIKSNGNLYVVRDENDSVFTCRIKGKMRLDDIKSTNPIAVGDYVMFEAQDNDESVIEEVLERRNYVVRKASNLSKQTHILAANVDQALLLVTINYPITASLRRPKPTTFRSFLFSTRLIATTRSISKTSKTLAPSTRTLATGR